MKETHAEESASGACTNCNGMGWTQASTGPEFADLYQEKCDACDGTGRRPMADTDLPERIGKIIEERDRAFALASEVIASLMLDRNADFVHPKLRDLANQAWLPALQALQDHRPLVGDALTYALEASGVDTEAAWVRVQAAIERAKQREGTVNA